MPLEATMIVIDNSEYMRNGDYHPSRFDAQTDAVNRVVQTKTDSNPENSVGIMTMAGKAPVVLVTNTRELGQIIQGTHRASTMLSGVANLPTAINVAQLALKHRQNKNLRQRIVVFLGSPLEGAGADEKGLVKLAKKLKKNNIAVDLVCFGDAIQEGESSVLRAFIDAVNNSENSHLVNAPPDPLHLLSDVISTSAVLSADRGTNEDGIVGMDGDDNVDQDLAMAIQRSLMDAGLASGQNPPGASTSATADDTEQPTSIEVTSDAAHVSSTQEELDEEQYLQQALALSRQGGDVEMADSGEEDESEEAAIARAIQMSLQEQESEGKKETKKNDEH